MTFSERAALEGVLSQLKPQLAVEIGTAEGGSLRRIATHSVEVHSFDLVEPEAAVRDLPNVTLHTGDSHVMLAEFLDHLAGAGGGVDFALVDGDHTAEGVRQDLEALLTAEAVQRCVISSTTRPTMSSAGAWSGCRTAATPRCRTATSTSYPAISAPAALTIISCGGPGPGRCRPRDPRGRRDRLLLELWDLRRRARRARPRRGQRPSRLATRGRPPAG